MRRGDPRYGYLLDLVDRMLPGFRFSRLTLNARRPRVWSKLALHTDGANVGPSALAVADTPFKGGVTRWADGRSVNTVNTWVYSNGHIPHYGEDVFGGGEVFSYCIYASE